jgi:uncharacterized protein (TIGR04255 family)
MSRNYQQPPLIEALCEFQFTSENWDWTIPGLVYQKIQTPYSIKRQMKMVEFELQTKSSGINPRVRDDVDRMQFLTPDEKSLVQVGQNMLAINFLRPYPKWGSFRERIAEMLGIYKDIAQPAAIKRIGLRYINQIEIPASVFNLNNYFNLQPKLPAQIPNQFGSVFMRVEIPYQKDNGVLVLIFASTPSALPDISSFILDLDFATSGEHNCQFDNYQDWIDKAHNYVETAFESCVTDQARQLFQEA